MIDIVLAMLVIGSIRARASYHSFQKAILKYRNEIIDLIVVRKSVP
jgi:hypothetical protein